MLAAGGALAADKKMAKPSMSVSGYAEHVVGGIISRTEEKNGEDISVDTNALDKRNNVEVFFNGNATLDNGIKIQARIELEGSSHTGGPTGVDADGNAVAPTPGAHLQPNAANSDDQIDEMFLAISGSFGKIVLGPTENAPVQMLTRPLPAASPLRPACRRAHPAWCASARPARGSAPRRSCVRCDRPVH